MSQKMQNKENQNLIKKRCTMRELLHERAFYITCVIIVLYIFTLPIALSFGGISFSELSSDIFFGLRVPRVCVPILVGMLLASSGVVVQSVFANPIADPYIIGVAASATLGAVIAYLFNLNDIYYGIFGFISSVFVSLLIFSIGRQRDMSTLLMLGVAISAFVGAFTTFAIYLIGEQSFRITAWLMGDFSSANWYRVGILCLPTLLCGWYFYSKRLELNILLHGDEEARSLGIHAGRLKISLLVASSFAIGFCVGMSGLIGFVGLIIPHILRLLLGNSNHSIVLPLSFLLGGLFLLACDTFGRSILFDGTAIPVGVITSFFGAPFFLYLALKRK